jgi:hypothetical protein
MIQRTSGGGYTTSLKGQFWMDHIRTIPYPVEVMRFAIPEQEREDR